MNILEEKQRIEDLASEAIAKFKIDYPEAEINIKNAKHTLSQIYRETWGERSEYTGYDIQAEKEAISIIKTEFGLLFKIFNDYDTGFKVLLSEGIFNSYCGDEDFSENTPKINSIFSVNNSFKDYCHQFNLKDEFVPTVFHNETITQLTDSIMGLEIQPILNVLSQSSKSAYLCPGDSPQKFSFFDYGHWIFIDKKISPTLKLAKNQDPLNFILDGINLPLDENSLDLVYYAWDQCCMDSHKCNIRAVPYTGIPQITISAIKLLKPGGLIVTSPENEVIETQDGVIKQCEFPISEILVYKKL